MRPHGVDIEQIFAARLRQLLEENDEKQVDLARALHVTEATVSRYLKGRLPDDIRILDAIATRYGTTIDWLVGRDLWADTQQREDDWALVGAAARKLGYTPETVMQILEALSAVQQNRKRES